MYMLPSYDVQTAYNVHKYSRCSAEVLQNVFGEDSSYTCSSGKQWVCRTCDAILTRGNIPVQALANGFKLPSIPSSSTSCGNIYLGLVEQFHYVGLDKVPSE